MMLAMPCASLRSVATVASSRYRSTPDSGLPCSSCTRARNCPLAVTLTVAGGAFVPAAARRVGGSGGGGASTGSRSPPRVMPLPAPPTTVFSSSRTRSDPARTWMPPMAR
ncbi:hypothetical protein D9M68_517430 [compost metagenome]